MIYYQRLNYAEIGIVHSKNGSKHYPSEVILSPEELVAALQTLRETTTRKHLVVLSRGCGHDGRYTLSFTETDEPLRGWPADHEAPVQPEWFQDALAGRVPVPLPYCG